jgi:Spy/CpxP family protein refolding chaperone
MRVARLMLAVCAAGVALPIVALAMPPHGRFGMEGRPPFMDELFPPRIVMQHQQEIGLRDSQREAITKAMTNTQAQLVDLQWRFEEASAALTKLLAQLSIDESAAIDQAGRVMAVEQELKKAHLSLLIQIKNQLDPAQQEKLRELRGHGDGHGSDDP